MNLKEQLCNYLIQNKMVEELDVIEHSYSTNRMNNFRKQSENNIAPTLTTRCDCLGVVVKESTNKDKPKVLGGIGDKKSNGGKQWYMQDRIYDNNIAISVTTAFNPYYLSKEKKMNNLRIRKLTPKECWRLMGFNDKDFDKASKVNSNAQLYKQAGNSIVVNVLEAILKNLLLENIDENILPGQMSIYDYFNE